MIIIFWITIFVILLYLGYPLWVLVFQNGDPGSPDEMSEANEPDGISVILLSYNGKDYLHGKITFLLKELSGIKKQELIVIDDKSTDGSQEILGCFRGMNRVAIILNDQHEGIPCSMNKGVAVARYEYVVFCDQRQQLSDHIFQRIVEPLNNKNIGAVSGCISNIDKGKRYSAIRRFENFIKSAESKTGSLIGVYGPLYAVKKSSYSTIPENIVLDDLYLSLKILRSKRIVLREDCLIFDDDPVALYNYERIRRYLTGFLQIMKEKDLISALSTRHKIMLMWHKYLRLIIPLLVFTSYLISGILALTEKEYLVLFCLLSFFGLISFVPVRFGYSAFHPNLIRMNILYFIGFIDVFFNRLLLRKNPGTNSRIATAGQVKLKKNTPEN